MAMLCSRHPVFGAGKDGITTNVLPIRKIDISKPRKIKYTIEITDFPLYTIEVDPINSSYTNVRVLYTGDGNDLDRYKWDFGKNHTVINGFGIGPYEISYNYGGYININLKNLDSKCSNLEYSDFSGFHYLIKNQSQPKIFKRRYAMG